MKGVSESLAGRVGIIDMFPLSINEKKGRLHRFMHVDKIEKILI